MITPLFVAFPSSRWRSHVEATWSYLQQHYEVTGNDDCGTHVHVSLEGGYSLDELKLVAQAALHLNPVSRHWSLRLADIILSVRVVGSTPTNLQ